MEFKHLKSEDWVIEYSGQAQMYTFQIISTEMKIYIQEETLFYTESKWMHLDSAKFELYIGYNYWESNKLQDINTAFKYFKNDVNIKAQTSE